MGLKQRGQSTYPSSQVNVHMSEMDACAPPLYGSHVAWCGFGGHAMQAVALPKLYMPGSHGEHAIECGPEYVPLGQGMHMSVVMFALVPAGQGVHVMYGGWLTYPGSQGKHCDMPGYGARSP